MQRFLAFLLGHRLLVLCTCALITLLVKSGKLFEGPIMIQNSRLDSR